MSPILLNMNSPPLIRRPPRTRRPPVRIPRRSRILRPRPILNILISGAHIQRPLLSLLSLLLRSLELTLRRGIRGIVCRVVLREVTVRAGLGDFGTLGVQ